MRRAVNRSRVRVGNVRGREREGEREINAYMSRLARVKVTRREGTRMKEIGRSRSFYVAGLTRASAPLPTLKAHPRARTRWRSAFSVTSPGRYFQSPRGAAHFAPRARTRCASRNYRIGVARPELRYDERRERRKIKDKKRSLRHAILSRRYGE